MRTKINPKARCKNCRHTWRELILLALMQDAGAQISGLCEPDEHEWDQPLIIKPFRVQTTYSLGVEQRWLRN